MSFLIEPFKQTYETAQTQYQHWVEHSPVLQEIDEAVQYVAKRILYYGAATTFYLVNHNLFVAGFMIGFASDLFAQETIDRVQMLWNLQLYEQFACLSAAVLTIKSTIPLICIISSSQFGTIAYRHAAHLSQHGTAMPRLFSRPIEFVSYIASTPYQLVIQPIVNIAHRILIQPIANGTNRFLLNPIKASITKIQEAHHNSPRLQKIVEIAKAVLFFSVGLFFYRLNHTLFLVGFLLGFKFDEKSQNVLDRVQMLWNLHLPEKIILGAATILSLHVSVTMMCVLPSMKIGIIAYRHLQSIS